MTSLAKNVSLSPVEFALRKSLDLISPEINTYGKMGGTTPSLPSAIFVCQSVFFRVHLWLHSFAPCLPRRLFCLVPLPRHCHWGQNVYAGRETIWAELVSNILWVPGLEGLVSPASAGSEYRSLRMRSHPAT